MLYSFYAFRNGQRKGYRAPDIIYNTNDYVYCDLLGVCVFMLIKVREN